MTTFMSNFNIFLTSFLSGLNSVWNWFIGTILGQVMLFIIIISIFAFLISLITGGKE